MNAKKHITIITALLVLTFLLSGFSRIQAASYHYCEPATNTYCQTGTYYSGDVESLWVDDDDLYIVVDVNIVWRSKQLVWYDDTVDGNPTGVRWSIVLHTYNPLFLLCPMAVIVWAWDIDDEEYDIVYVGYKYGLYQTFSFNCFGDDRYFFEQPSGNIWQDIKIEVYPTIGVAGVYCQVAYDLVQFAWYY